MWVGDLPICKIAHSLLEVRAALAGSCFLERCRRLWRARDNLLGSKVFDDISEGIDIGDAAAEGVDSRGGGVAAAHHIAAEGEVGMLQAELAEESSGDIRLVAERLDAARLTHSTANPHYGDAVAIRIGLVDAGRIVDTVIGGDDEQQVVPNGRGLEPRYELADAVIKVAHSVGNLVVLDAVIGHLPILMTGEGEASYH